MTEPPARELDAPSPNPIPAELPGGDVPADDLPAAVAASVLLLAGLLVPVLGVVGLVSLLRAAGT